MKIYAEWFDENGSFDNRFFSNWDEFHNFAFNPDITVTLVKIMK